MPKPRSDFHGNCATVKEGDICVWRAEGFLIFHLRGSFPRTDCRIRIAPRRNQPKHGAHRYVAQWALSGDEAETPFFEVVRFETTAVAVGSEVAVDVEGETFTLPVKSEAAFQPPEESE